MWRRRDSDNSDKSSRSSLSAFEISDMQIDEKDPGPLDKRIILEELNYYKKLSDIETLPEKFAAWCSYLKWKRVYYPVTSSSYIQDLEGFLKLFFDENGFKNQELYLIYWIEYLGICKDFQEAIESLEENGIGNGNVFYYDEIARLCEQKNDLVLASHFLLKAYKLNQSQIIQRIKEMEEGLKRRIAKMKQALLRKEAKNGKQLVFNNGKRCEPIGGFYEYPLDSSKIKKFKNENLNAQKLSSKQHVFVGDISIFVDEKYRANHIIELEGLTKEYKDLLKKTKSEPINEKNESEKGICCWFFRERPKYFQSQPANIPELVSLFPNVLFESERNHKYQKPITKESPFFPRSYLTSMRRMDSYLSLKSRSAEISSKHYKINGETTGVFLKKFNKELEVKLQKFEFDHQKQSSVKCFSFRKTSKSSACKEFLAYPGTGPHSPPFVRKLRFSEDSDIKKNKRSSSNPGITKPCRNFEELLHMKNGDSQECLPYKRHEEGYKECLTNLTNSQRKKLSKDKLPSSSVNRKLSADCFPD